MIYRYIVCILLALLLIICSGCSKNTNNQDDAYKSTENTEEINMTYWVVYVNGSNMGELPISISSRNVRLPFVQIVDALGMIIENTNEAIYIKNNSDTYVLCHSPSVSLIKQGDTDNLMLPPPGTSSYYCRYELGDVFLDTDTLDEVLYRMGVNIDVSVDYKSSTISIINMTK